MTERIGTAIIGGGIAGCALAHYLAEEGETSILVVDADELGSGSTGGSFGGVRQQFSTPLEIELSRRGLDFWRSAERVFESPVTWHANGYLFLTGQPEIMTKLGEAAALQRSMGLNDVHVLDAEQIRDTVPWVGTDGVLAVGLNPFRQFDEAYADFLTLVAGQIAASMARLASRHQAASSCLP